MVRYAAEAYQETINFTGVSGPLRVIGEAGELGDFPIIDGKAEDSVVLFGSAENDNSVILANFTIQNGRGNNSGACSSSSARCGGGIAIRDGAAPQLANLIVRSNEATYGGGIYINGKCPVGSQCAAQVILTDVWIGSRSGSKEEENSASSFGGGLYVVDGKVELGGQVAIVRNHAQGGGGIYLFGNSVVSTAMGSDLESAKFSPRPRCSRA